MGALGLSTVVAELNEEVTGGRFEPVEEKVISSKGVERDLRPLRTALHPINGVDLGVKRRLRRRRKHLPHREQQALLQG